MLSQKHHVSHELRKDTLIFCEFTILNNYPFLAKPQSL